MKGVWGGTRGPTKKRRCAPEKKAVPKTATSAQKERRRPILGIFGVPQQEREKAQRPKNGNHRKIPSRARNKPSNHMVKMSASAHSSKKGPGDGRLRQQLALEMRW